MKIIKTIYVIFVTVGIILIIFVGWAVIISSDAYQQYHRKKVLNSYLSGTNENLFLKQVITGEEPAIATFEVPVKYDLLKYPEYLHLVVDPRDNEDHSGKGGEFQECNRATNGNSLLLWNTTFDPPGQHTLQAQLSLPEKEKSRRTFEVRGPVVPFYSSNICQFDPMYSYFNSRGAILHAKLPEPNGIYTVELKSPTGEHIKTLAGTTSNGVINVKWDLKDDHGNKCTNDSFKAIFNVTLPDSGRSQTLRGP
ncbi:MAG: hypothetical protein ABSE97_01570 [Verrucomicrobiota bacterium]|jgi:hypothetical protein